MSDEIEKLKMHSPDLTAQNVERIAALFPGCVTESTGPDGTLRRAVDFDLLRQELSDSIVDGPQERYHLDWPGKRQALITANAPIAKTLRPVRAESVDFDTTRNLFIEGDNLEALKLLQETYLGKVKMIYIDPPYNTGNDFIYDDDFSVSANDYFEGTSQSDTDGNRLVANTESNGRFHSDWLSMIAPRLRLAKNLLADDGVIFISIDDHEVQNLRNLGNEIFGEQNFVTSVIWQRVFSPKNSAQWFSEDHDYVLIFAKNKNTWRPNLLPQTEEMISRYKNPDNDERGPWTSSDLAARNRYDAGLYAITCPSGRVIEGPPKGRYWGVSEENFQRLNQENRIWWGADGNNMPRLKRFLSEVKQGITPQTLWFYKDVGHTQDAKKTLLKYVPFENTENVLNSVKPVALIQRMIQLATDAQSQDIVLDFFSGSAPTAHAVLEQNKADGGNRRFIGVQVAEPLRIPESKMKTIFDMGKLRVESVISEMKKEGIESLGFRVLKIDSSNMADVYYTPDATTQADLLTRVDNIKPDRTPEDLLFQVLLDWGVDLTLPITRESVAGKTVFTVAGTALIACFDNGVDETLVKTLATRHPLRVVFKDTGFKDDATKINVRQIFKSLSPDTEVKAI
ncbi:site-specific DNA-methyltransferase [Sulfitobacter sp. R18_2]|jgi:adenine-specific DNA-methyltransferase|uniref:site-specific DNA-methyltransferase n=1 Tax=Sulfitobacter sp. R18_2 TaxID=2821105 RepID=UPI001ADB6B4B|nr:site-specific DNA-methyltransferase [Sulfitobacter sp. R18_2]MBO9439795.1 site-specific DNA-methyltransferase [Sulfitobacter sp. R18_2]